MESIVAKTEAIKLRALTSRTGNRKFCTLQLAALCPGDKSLANFMNKLLASVGLAAIGASTLQAQSVPGLTPTMSKPWSVSATLRGFYDDNLNTSSSSSRPGVFGIEVSPAVGLQWASPQTHVSLAYIYTFKEYDHRPSGQTEKYDQTHSINLANSSAFNKRHEWAAASSSSFR